MYSGFTHMRLWNVLPRCFRTTSTTTKKSIHGKPIKILFTSGLLVDFFRLFTSECCNAACIQLNAKKRQQKIHEEPKNERIVRECDGRRVECVWTITERENVARDSNYWRMWTLWNTTVVMYIWPQRVTYTPNFMCAFFYSARLSQFIGMHVGFQLVWWYFQFLFKRKQKYSYSLRSLPATRIGFKLEKKMWFLA